MCVVDEFKLNDFKVNGTSGITGHIVLHNYNTHHRVLNGEC
jgi:hypothetical protein